MDATLGRDDERMVDLSDDAEAWVDSVEEFELRGTSENGSAFRDSVPVLPETTRDDTDAGWGERPRDNDFRLLDERPPHWE